MTRPKHDVQGAIFFWLHQAQQAMRIEIVRLFRERGYEITAEQWTLLAAVWQKPGLSQAALAKMIGRDKPGVTRLIDGLQSKSLVDRVADPNDRRRYEVHLTARGKAMHDALSPVVDEVLGKALTGLSAAQKAEARATLKQLVTNLRG